MADVGANDSNNNNNNNNNDQQILSDENLGQNGFTGTPIQRFYAGQKIFITGGTGFLGKILTEKLLRCCPDISRIYLLIRSKKGKDSQSRVEELFNDRIYERMRKLVPNFRDKIVPINGDCRIKGLSMSEEDVELLAREVSIVFHVAATVRFDEELDLATAINVRSTNDVLALCKQMPKLKAFIHVSTAYANCHLPQIEERFYDYPVGYKDLLKRLDNLPQDAREKVTSRHPEEWPNTYAFTKAIAESVVKENSGDLPIGIFRPAIVVSTAEEPLVGWIDNLYGPTGVVTAGATGILKAINFDPTAIADLVPVDITVNALIVSAWDVFTQTQRRGKNMLIYNFVSSVDAPLTWHRFSNLTTKYVDVYPPNTCVWYYSYLTIKNRLLFCVTSMFVHFLPAALMDLARICMFRKPRLWKMYTKIHKFSNAIAHFCLNNWKFSNDNVKRMWQRTSEKDKQLFGFNMAGFDWEKYFETYVLGIRTYLLNEDPETLPASRARLRRLYWLDRGVKGLLLLAIVRMFWSFLLPIFL